MSMVCTARFARQSGPGPRMRQRLAAAPPSPSTEAEMEHYCRVRSPLIQRTMFDLERRGLSRRLPRQASSIAPPGGIAVSRHTLVIYAVAAICSSLGAFGCGGKVNSVVASDAATGGNVVDQGASAGVDGSGLSSSGGTGSGSGDGPGSTSGSGGSSGGTGSTSSSSGIGESCAATCTNGCCDSTGDCRNSGDSTCGFFGTACSDCTATGATCVSGTCVGEPGVHCDADAGAAVSPDAAACLIDLNQYDRSCSSDSDCVSQVPFPCSAVPTAVLYVRGGNFCDYTCNCPPGSPISQSAVAQYIADVSGTPHISVRSVDCSCPPTRAYYPKCMNGSCVIAPG
jgi:hypothetical protein